MEKTLGKGQIETLILELLTKPALNTDSNIISLTSNELADLSLRISSYIRKEPLIDELLESTINALGQLGIAERILLFQIDNEGTNALLSHQWESPYISKINHVGFQIDLRDIPLFKFFHLNLSHTLQIQNISKFMSLPNYLFRNKLKAFLLKLKTRAILLTTGSSHKVKVVLNLQFVNKEAIWSNETEKVLQSITDQLALAIDQSLDKRNKEVLQKNIVQLQEKAIREQEELLRQFASDVHDLPCSIIPNLKHSIRKKDFEECERLVDELHYTLRQLINEYIIPDINLLGFGNTICQFINGFRKSFKGKVIVDLPDEEISLSDKKSIELFKAIKEWFCNIEKHSGANEVNFTMKKLNKNYILISISDNGKGFDATSTKNLGYGILNIRRRLSEIKSLFEIKSEINKGASLKIQISV